MRVLIYTLNYEPELTGIGKYSGEMASWLAENGHDVRVVTSFPYYPQWHIQEGYSARWYIDEVKGRVALTRCPLWVPAKPGGLKRLLHLASFALTSFPALLRQFFWRPDVVWVVAPAFFCVPGALLASRLCGAKAWLHIQDYEVDAAFDLGMLKGERLKRTALSVERWLLRGFDRFSTISHRMHQLALSKGVAIEKAVLFPNWVDLDAITSTQQDTGRSGYRSELNIPDDSVVALYSGNMGAKQGLEILAEAASRLKSQEGLHFIFCGNGAGRADLEKRASGLPNVRFLDLQPLERLGELLGTADIHLLPQRGDAADLVMPSKLTGMLASGKAVVATAHAGTEVAMVVDGCGLVVPPEEPVAFSEAILRLAQDRELRDRFGKAGRVYAEQHLDRNAVLRSFEAELKRLIAT
ncbi:colanic acid biosynthesis glycosyltransferase WcaI [Zoogloea oleivorans]|uniref:Colanic acid biosynthesis glycosyltransferase WcaI n=1 Tax=Zoogloea oleivorans TaxID=1552750 RepID=A0A6C2CE20_9RHOO|nr:glycosyltransferase WbuB [Zoogloea oleivorans]TYC51809.1 colanic acid biosynthesis glycosyltransferase WcaI [Zoogloea oleivorans]